MVRYVVSFVAILALAVAANKLGKINPVIEFPIWAAILGIIAGNIPRISTVIKKSANTEFFIKIGLVLLGASVNFSVILSVGWRGITQAMIGIPLVFFFSWWLAGRFGVDHKLRALMSSALSICGVSAAIAAAGSVTAKKEQLTYVVALVILFALPLMVIIPAICRVLDLPPAVAGSWIGNNIDTTAAVTGAGTILGEDALKVASVVKMAQNCFIGVAAFLLSLYFALKVEKRDNKPKAIEIWHRFPKFVIGFVAVSLMVTLGVISGTDTRLLSALRKWFFCIAFVCIGMGFSFKEIRAVGGRPLAVFAIATVFNTATAYGLAWLLFGDYEV